MLTMNLVKFIPGYVQTNSPWISTGQIFYCFTQFKKNYLSQLLYRLTIDSNLNWKSHINYIAKKIKRCIGILSKLRYYLNSKTVLDLYYALVYPFLTYCLIAWGNTYQTSLQPLFVLQKKAIRIITFSSLSDHTSPLFKDLNVFKLFDEVTFHIAVFMYNLKINFFLLILMSFPLRLKKLTITTQDFPLEWLMLYP